MRRDRQRLGELWYRQVPGYPARVRLGTILHETQFEADALDRAGQDRGPTGRAIAVPGQLLGDLDVAGTCGTQDPNLLRHFGRCGQVRQRPNRDRHLKGGGLPAAPDNAGVHLLAPGPLDDHLVNETAQQGFALGLRQDVSRPEGGQLLANSAESRLQRGRQRGSGRCTGLDALRLGRFGLLEGLQSNLPRVFQCGGDMAMGRIDVAELALTLGGLIAQPLEMLRVGLGEALGLLLPLGQRLFVDIALHGREGLEKRIDDPRIDRIGCNILTYGGAILLPQIIADFRGAKSAHILHRNPQCFSRILLLFVS